MDSIITGFEAIENYAGSNDISYVALVISGVAFLFAVATYIRFRRYIVRVKALEKKVAELRQTEEARFHADLVARGLMAGGREAELGSVANDRHGNDEPVRLAETSPR